MVLSSIVAIMLSKESPRTGTLLLLFLMGAMASICSSCGNSMEQIAMFQQDVPPDQSIRHADIVRSEKGDLQLTMKAPLILKYSKPESKTVYPEGVEITFFDSDRSPKAFFTAKEAVSYDDRNLIEARDSVVLIDYRSHDTTYLQDLVWDSKQHRIYSEHPLRSVNGSRVTYGDSFESDENFENPQILHQRGTIEWNDEEDEEW